MTKTIEEANTALVREAFDTLFNKRDYNAAGRFWWLCQKSPQQRGVNPTNVTPGAIRITQV